MSWQQPQLTDPPMVSDEIRKLQHRLLLAYPANSKAVELGVKETGVFDQATDQALRNLQPHLNPPQPATGVLTYATKIATGVISTPIAAAPTLPPMIGFGVPGTWGVWHTGPQAAMFYRADPARVQFQGVGFNTGAFLTPDPSHSYLEARNEGTAELLRLALPDPRPKFISGYSMGADVVVRFLQQWPAERRDEIRAVFTFGSPGCPPGPTKLGPHTGAGIAGVYTPEWARDREWSYAIPGDMYPESVGLLPQLYEILTRMEASLDFMMYLFRILTSSFGPALLGLAGAIIPGMSGLTAGFGALSSILGMVTPGPVTDTTGEINLFAMMANLPAIIATLFAALKFVFTNAHQKYWVDKVFDGMTAEDHAAAVVRRLVA